MYRHTVGSTSVAWKPVVVLRALGYAVLGLMSFVLLAVSLISAGKEYRSGERLKGLVFFIIAIIIGLCILVVLLTAYVHLGE